MNKYEYHQLAQRTSAPPTPAVVTRIKNPAVLADLRFALENVAVMCEMIDKIKKHIFYGKPYNPERPQRQKDDNAGDQIRNESHVKILHGLIGSIGESGEMASAILSFLYEGKELDHVNILEEIGDQMWYHAETAAGCGVMFDCIQEGNIQKLSARYPDKFTEEKAETRDLEKERFALEGSFSAKDKTIVNESKSVNDLTPEEIKLIGPDKVELLRKFKG